MPKFYVLEQIRCAVTFVRAVEAEDEDAAVDADCKMSGDPLGFHLGHRLGDTMELFALPAEARNLPEPFYPEPLPLFGAASPASSDAPADPVKAEMLAALRITTDACRAAAGRLLDRPTYEASEYAALQQAAEHGERQIARAEGRA
jgi:hypothetical protein